jgi:hypothetical protein
MIQTRAAYVFKLANDGHDTRAIKPISATNRILSLRPSGGLPTLVLSLRLCFGDALPLPFEHHLALELGHRGKHVEH